MGAFINYSNHQQFSEVLDDMDYTHFEFKRVGDSGPVYVELWDDDSSNMTSLRVYFGEDDFIVEALDWGGEADGEPNYEVMDDFRSRLKALGVPTRLG